MVDILFITHAIARHLYVRRAHVGLCNFERSTVYSGHVAHAAMDETGERTTFWHVLAVRTIRKRAR